MKEEERANAEEPAKMRSLYIIINIKRVGLIFTIHTVLVFFLNKAQYKNCIMKYVLSP